MRLDIDVPLGQLYPDNDQLRAAMVEVARHKIEGREAAVYWAEHLRFVAADTNSRSVEVTEHEGSEDEYCICAAYPSVTLSQDEKQLMVTDSSDLADCSHYLAVSYCCSSSAKAEYHGRPYSIRRKGIVGSPACPSDMLERVIRFAKYCGLDYLWIDQECIEQDDPNDKDIGIQAMDMVYQMADQAVAVLEVKIKEQRHLDALGLLQSCGFEDLASTDLQDLIEALEVILSDPWFTRTWCLQESTSAARDMALLIRRDPSLQLPDSLRGRSQTEFDFEIDLSALQEQIPGWVVYQVDRIAESGDPVLHARGVALLAAWSQMLIPDVGPSSDRVDFRGGRPVCDAAEALRYMGLRCNTITSDRLAILANLCQYNIRLNDRELDQLGYGFSICAITLAVLNGDFSLMAGVATYYAGLTGKVTMLLSDGEESAKRDRAGFSWNIPSELSIDHVLFWDKREDSFRHMYEPELCDKGLVVTGSLWIVDKVLDLSQLRESFLQRENQRNIAWFLEDGTLGQRAPSEDARARLMLSFLCRLHRTGHVSLMKRIWQELRLNSSRRDNPEIERWSNADFEDIVDVSSETVKWHSPLPKIHSWASRMPTDPFIKLRGRFVHYLLSSILLHARLPIGRLHQSEPTSTHYDAIFDNASNGDMYLAPVTNMGLSSPSRDRGWYPVAWRVVRDTDDVPHDEGIPSFKCHGLVGGHWTAQADDLTAVRLC